MCYSVYPRDLISLKGYRLLSFAKDMGKNLGKNLSHDLSGKYRHQLLDYARKTVTDKVKTFSKKAVKKLTEATGNLISNTIADKIKYQKFHLKIILKGKQKY